MEGSPFHSGEKLAQHRVGQDDVERWATRMIRPFLPEQHREFYAQLPFLIGAARDADGRPWATVLNGEPGFARSPEPTTLDIHARPVPGDALEAALRPGADLGVLGIELSTRRRNRANGRLGDGAALRLRVDQSFGNCPQYIQEREWTRVAPNPEPARRSAELDSRQEAMIRTADTFFIASGYRGDGEHPSYGMDASHRGGQPGFVQVSSPRGLVFPDYSGNNLFNTIGNLVRDPRVGLLFLNFAEGTMLQLTGRATILWDGPEVDRIPDARRLVVIELDGVVELPHALPLRWSRPNGAVRSLRLAQKLRESADVTSFVFESRDGGPLAPFLPGQYLPLKLGPDLERSYSLSNAPTDGQYRISVKREPRGRASRFLHDEVQVGAMLDAGAPSGDFVLQDTPGPHVFISAGIGQTPVLSMLHALSGSPRSVFWFHGARDGAHHPFAGEVKGLARTLPRLHSEVRYSRPKPEEIEGQHFDRKGHLRSEEIMDQVNDPHAEYYVCGPDRFIAEIVEGLESAGVSSTRIHVESFGS
ncbi:MAG: pyridoxamine 5'-phosphate oxidase family protein [Myxococcota bacterium]